MHPIHGVVRHYAWGSTTALAELTGRPAPTAQPEAEIWFGAHPLAPSPLSDTLGPPITPDEADAGAGGDGDGEADADGSDASGGSAPAAGMTLAGHLNAHPDEALGAVAQTLSSTPDSPEVELPFLLKLLAADRALSIQVHPTREQARAGFAADNAAGLTLDASERNYKDANHKPELIVALTPFRALAGFRTVEQIRSLIALIDVEDLTDALSAAEQAARASSCADPGTGRGTGAESEPYGDRVRRELITRVLRLDCAAQVASRAAALIAHEDTNPLDSWERDAAEVAVEVAADFPGDVGIICSLLLRVITLEPGEGLFLTAGQLHAYLSGVGVELMANSDNVLRAGLTEKHVDVTELLRILDCSAADSDNAPISAPAVENAGHDAHAPDLPTLRPSPATSLVVHPDEQGRYRTPVDEFALRRIPGRADAPGGGVVSGPAIVLAVRGAVNLRSAGESAIAYSAGPGEAVWIDAGESPVTVTVAEGDLAFVAQIGAAAD